MSTMRTGSMRGLGASTPNRLVSTLRKRSCDGTSPIQRFFESCTDQLRLAYIPMEIAQGQGVPRNAKHIYLKNHCCEAVS